MKYAETKMSFEQFLTLLKSVHDDFLDNYDAIGDYAVDGETVDCGIQGYPVFYYFNNLEGKKYVLEENEGNDCSVIYEVIEVDEANEHPCKIILRDTVGMWDGDAYENLALYRLTPDFKYVEADEDDTDVKIWVTYYYSYSTCNAPIDHYLRNVDIDDSCQDADDYEPKEFATYAEAKAWIDEQESGRYYLSHGEIDRPKYTIIT